MSSGMRMRAYEPTNSIASLFSGISDNVCLSLSESSSILSYSQVDNSNSSTASPTFSLLKLKSKEFGNHYSPRAQYTIGSRKIARKPAYPGQRIKMVQLKNAPVESAHPLQSYSRSNFTRKSNHGCGYTDILQSISDSENLTIDILSQGDIGTGATRRRTKSEEPAPCSTKDAFVKLASKKHADSSLTPWEQWVLDKEAERLKAMKITAKTKIANERRKKSLERQQKEKQELSKRKLKEWAARNLAEQEKTKERIKSTRMAELAAETKREAAKAKAEKIYQDWLEEKNRDAKAEKLFQDKKRCHDERILLAKKKEAQAVFEEWKKKTGNTLRRLPCTHGISDGVVIRYFDRTSAPAPSFYNKQEWNS